MNYSRKEFYIISCTTLHHVPVESEYQVELYVYFGLTIIFSIATSTVNLLIIVATLKQKKKLQVDILLINLSCADFMSGLSLPIFSVNFVLAQKYYHYCSFYLISVALVYAAAFGCVSFSFIMVFERYLSIFFPFTYEKVMNTRYKHVNVFLASCITVWLVFIFLIIIPCLSKSFLFLKPAIAVFLPLAVILIFSMNIQIYFFARKMRTTIKKNYARPVQWISSNQKLLRVLLAVSVSLILCYVPYLILELHGSFSVSAKSSRMEMMFLWGTFSATFKSLINPCLYIYSFKKIRKSITRITSFNEKKQQTIEKTHTSLRGNDH